MDRKIKSLYQSFVVRLNDPKEHLNAHERYLIRMNVHGCFNAFKTLFYEEIKAAGLSSELTLLDDTDFQKEYDESLEWLNNKASQGCKVKGNIGNAA